MIQTLLYIFVLLCIVSLIVWGISQITDIPPIIKTVVYVVVGVIVLLWLLSALGHGSALHLSSPGPL